MGAPQAGGQALRGPKGVLHLPRAQSHLWKRLNHMWPSNAQAATPVSLPFILKATVRVLRAPTRLSPLEPGAHREAEGQGQHG